MRHVVLLAICVTACGARTNDSTSSAGETVFVRAVQRVFPPDCIAKADPTVAMLSKGTFDTALSSEYRAWLLIGNRAHDDPGAAGGKIAKVSTVDVTLSDLAMPGNPVLATYTVDATGVVDPATDAGGIGYGVASAQLLPPGVVAPIAARLRGTETVATYKARFVLHGAFVDGSSFKSAEYDFDIDVCDGCSIGFPAEAIDFTLPLPNCARSGLTDSVQTACAGQDGITDCRQCQGVPECTPCASDSQCVPSGRCGPRGACFNP